MKRLIATFLACLMPFVAQAQVQNLDDVIAAEIRPGWRVGAQQHMAALHLSLAPGWKTYWRAPGDAGIPPQFEWRRARNMSAVNVFWPAPRVFYQEGMRSVGYTNEVVIPLQVSLRDSGKDVRLRGVIDIGVCKDICLPHRLRVDAALPASVTKPDPKIAAALADQPYSAREAGVRAVKCQVSPISGGLQLRTEIEMPARGNDVTVIETADPQVWVAEPKSWWEGGRLVSETRLLHIDGGGFALDRSGVRITVLGGSMPVDIRGCTG